MSVEDLISINRDELFTPEQQKEIEKALKLFEGFSRRRLKEDPERMGEVQEIFCEAKRTEKI